MRSETVFIGKWGSDLGVYEAKTRSHALGHYRDVTLVSLRIMDAVRQQAGITFPADAGKQA